MQEIIDEINQAMPGQAAIMPPGAGGMRPSTVTVPSPVSGLGGGMTSSHPNQPGIGIKPGDGHSPSPNVLQVVKQVQEEAVRQQVPHGGGFGNRPWPMAPPVNQRPLNVPNQGNNGGMVGNVGVGVGVGVGVAQSVGAGGTGAGPDLPTGPPLNTQLLAQIMQRIKKNPANESSQHMLTILKQNPQIMVAIIKQRQQSQINAATSGGGPTEAMQAGPQQQQQQQQQQMMQVVSGGGNMGGIPNASAQNAVAGNGGGGGLGPNVMGPPTPHSLQQQLMQSARSSRPIRSTQPAPSPRSAPSASQRAQPSPHHQSPLPGVCQDVGADGVGGVGVGGNSGPLPDASDS